MKNQHRNVNQPSKFLFFFSFAKLNLNFNRCQKHFESIRLFLSNYGFCSLDSMYQQMNGKQWVRKKTKTEFIRLLKICFRMNQNHLIVFNREFNYSIQIHRHLWMILKNLIKFLQHFIVLDKYFI
jgi:hypothetical protein